jgi:cytidylate kinase
MSTASIPVLAIDGPSGSGKGTIGQILAQALGWHFLDSGAVYRAVGYIAAKEHVDPSDTSRLERLSRDLNIRFEVVPGGTARVLLGNEEIGDGLRTEEAGKLASVVAAVPQVRAALLDKQHAFRKAPGLVADGRDMGTTVFPDAILKIFLTASAEVRAERRYKQLKEKGFDANLSQLLGEIRARDERDAARAASPLKPAADASILDTSVLSISEVTQQIERLLRDRLSEFSRSR